MSPAKREQLQEELQQIIGRYGLTDVRDVFDELASTPGEHTKCSFCGRGADEIDRLVAGSGAFICSDCIDRCYNLSKKAH